MLDVDGRPMLIGVVDALLCGGVARVTLVVSSEVRATLPGPPKGVRVVVNDDATTQMIDSIRIGLETDNDEVDSEVAGYLVCPCDAPGIAAADVRRCLDVFAETSDHIVVATHGGHRGHPMIFPASLAAAVRSAECDGGLNRLTRNRPQQVREVSCASAGTVANVNTQADYERLRWPSGVVAG